MTRGSKVSSPAADCASSNLITSKSIDRDRDEIARIVPNIRVAKNIGQSVEQSFQRKRS